MADRGPTQGAERHAAAHGQAWTGRPGLARVLRLLLFIVPLLVSFGFSIAAGRLLPAHELGMNRWLWIAVVFLLANVLLVVLRRLTSRLIPLVALMKLTLVFPDNAPSRTKAVLRSSNSRAMLRTMREAQERGETTGEARNGDYLVQLLQEVNDHDRLTRGHSERVRAYAEMLGAEIGLDDEDLNKLRWAALLHDVGKLTVPSEILNKKGRPTDAEWETLSGHPAAAVPLLEPLRDWLGEWVHAADQHHCRWDGDGYPSGLAGTDITLAGRLVAIADAYDVMTSTRSYKKPLAPEVARQELTDCAGSQFDPTLVRAFLQIGLGRLTSVAGPFAWFWNLTGSAQLPIPAANLVSTGAWSVGAAATALVTVGVGGVLSPPAPETIALDVSAVVADDIAVTATAGRSVDVVLTAEGDALTFTIGGAVHGEVELVSFPQAVDADGARWQATASYTPTDAYVGEDAFSFEACDREAQCDQGTVVLTLVAADRPPTTLTSTTTAPPTTLTSTTTAPPTTAPPVTAPPSAPTTTARPSTTTGPTTTVPEENLGPIVADDRAQIDEDQVLVVDVLSNDDDPEGDQLSISGVGRPIHGAASIVGAGVRYEPPANFAGTDQFTYTVSDGVNPSAAGTVTVSVSEVNDPPVVDARNASIDEDATIGSIISTVTVTDPDDSIFSFTLSGDPTGRFSIDQGGVIRVAAPLDHENTLTHNVVVKVSDFEAETTDSLQIQVLDVDEVPMAIDDAATTNEDTSADVDLLANDEDPEGRTLSVDIDSASVQGGSLALVDGVATYTPAPDYEGNDTFTYRLKDPAGNISSSATVTMTVVPVNDSPVTADDFGVGFATSEDVAFTTVDVRSNDADVDDPVLSSSVEVTVDATRGALINNGDGTFDYAPDPDVFGADTFQYRLVDSSGAPSAVATVTIDVGALNDPPVANPDTLTVITNSAADTVDLRVNDADVDGDSLTVSAVSDGASGTVVSNGDGTVTYTHDGSATTSDSFSYTVTDPSGASDTALVAVTVVAFPDNDGVGAGDNCPFAYNPNQLDTDGDGVGDGCDSTPTSTSSGTYDGGLPLPQDDSQAVAVADFDGDGDTDVVFANFGEANKVFNNGLGGLLFPDPQDLDTGDSLGVAVGDLDGDGSIDIVFANDGANSVWLNDGSGDFSSTGQTIGNDESWAVAVGDVDGDSDLDLVFGNVGEANRLWLNNGAGTFAPSQAMGSRDSKGVVFEDLDGDGDLDLSVSNDGTFDTIWLNNGAGVFVDSGQKLGIGRSHESVVADLDGDGFPDIAIAGDNQGDTIWLNDGFGQFTRTPQSIGIGHSRAIAAGDIDGDGDLDLVFGDHNGANTVWLNNGAASFTDAGQTIGADATEGIVLVDLDGDGDLGIVVANDSDANRYYGNS